MNQPMILTLKFTAIGLVALLIVALIGSFFMDSFFMGSLNSFAPGAPVAVFVLMLFYATTAAYEHGKKDALAERTEQ